MIGLQPTACEYVGAGAAGRGVEEQPTHRGHCRVAINAQQKRSFAWAPMRTTVFVEPPQLIPPEVLYWPAPQLQSLLLALLNTT